MSNLDISFYHDAQGMATVERGEPGGSREASAGRQFDRGLTLGTRSRDSPADFHATNRGNDGRGRQTGKLLRHPVERSRRVSALAPIWLEADLIAAVVVGRRSIDAYERQAGFAAKPVTLRPDENRDVFSGSADAESFAGEGRESLDRKSVV